MNLGNCPALAAAFPPDNRRIAGASAGLIQIRGWCLTKMNGFQLQEAASKLRSVERDGMATSGAESRVTIAGYGTGDDFQFMAGLHCSHS